MWIGKPFRGMQYVKYMQKYGFVNRIQLTIFLIAHTCLIHPLHNNCENQIPDQMKKWETKENVDKKS